uniref:Uncharacterized protein LOC104215355 n=1 Tax=Nicotiana sylvestris TaxID=4096 RepID=A0A1U7VM50_NICSY|nr:PREDICTED: uncharacterized protein LOC104215355 [Nicotiana sylvestris]
MRSVVEEGHVEINSTSLTWGWRNKYIEYLKNGKLPSDPKESRAMRTKVSQFSLFEDGTLLRRMFDGPLAICLGLGDTEYVLREIHEDTCGNHSGAESLVRKVIRAGYYWIDMEKYAKKFVQKYDKCQRHAPMIHQPGELLHSVLSPWPIRRSGRKKSSTSFGTISYVNSEYHPKLHVTIGNSLSATRIEVNPFSLVYGAKTLIPVEIREPSIRFRYATKESNDEAVNTSLELLDERREGAFVRLAAQKQRIERYYNRRANLRYFNIGDLVLRKVTLNTRNQNEGKLGSNWEGPYQILEITGKRSYKVGTMDGEQLSNN